MLKNAVEIVAALFRDLVTDTPDFRDDRLAFHFLPSRLMFSRNVFGVMMSGQW